MTQLMKDGVIYENRRYKSWRKVIIILGIANLAAPALIGTLLYLKRPNDPTIAIIGGVFSFLLLYLASELGAAGGSSRIPQWIKKDKTFLILHYNLKGILVNTIKDVPVDIRTITRMEFIEWNGRFGAGLIIIYTRENTQIQIGVDKEIFEMLKDLYFSMRGVDNPNKVVQQ